MKKPLISILEPKWLIVVTFFAAGIFLGGLAIYLWFGSGFSIAWKIHPAQLFYQHINPLLAVDVYNSPQFSQNTSLALEFRSLIDAYKKKGDISTASVYFRDIEPGIWVGINDDLTFSPGKLLKLPLMIAYYKLAESNPAILDRTIVYNGPDENQGLIFGSKEGLVVGEAYTVNDLIEKMVIDYDDNATNLLFDAVDKPSLNEIFSDLGINFKEDKYSKDFISLKLYSLFFRILYNATYLNRNYSEKALELLIKSPDNIGLGGELPKGVEFANRLGARTLTQNSSGPFEVYDCGIVYYPNHPYLICASAVGMNLETIERFFSEIGRAAYVEVDYKHKS